MCIRDRDQTVTVQYESTTIEKTRQKADVSVVKKDSDTENPLDEMCIRDRVETTSSCVFWLTGKSGYQEFISERPTADPIKAYIKVKTDRKSVV